MSTYQQIGLRPPALTIDAGHHQGGFIPPHKPRHDSRRPHRRPRHGGWVCALALTIAGGGAILFSHLLQTPAAAPPATLVQQMQLAVHGNAPSHHLFGGSLRVTWNGGQPLVTADNVPQKSCVEAGWELARKGLVTVNGVTPMRLSAGKLSELCTSDDGGGATITWAPRLAPQ